MAFSFDSAVSLFCHKLPCECLTSPDQTYIIHVKHLMCRNLALLGNTEGHGSLERVCDMTCCSVITSFAFLLYVFCLINNCFLFLIFSSVAGSFSLV